MAELTNPQRARAINGLVARFLDDNLRRKMSGLDSVLSADAETVRNFAYSIAGDLPEGRAQEMRERLDATRGYTDAKAELTAATAVTRDMLQLVTDRLAEGKSKSGGAEDAGGIRATLNGLQRKMARFSAFGGPDKLARDLEAEASAGAPLPAAPAMPAGATTVTAEQRLQAMERLFAQEFASDRMDARRIRDFGASLLDLVPAAERDAFRSRLNDSTAYAARPDAEKAAATIAVRGMFRRIIADGNATPSRYVSLIESAATTWMGETFPSRDALNAKVALDAAAPSAMPDMPAAPRAVTPELSPDARPQPSAARDLAALQAVLAKTMDDNLKLPEGSPARISGADMANFATALAARLPEQEKNYYQVLLYNSRTLSNNDRLTAATALAREILQKRVDYGMGSFATVDELKDDALNYGLGKNLTAAMLNNAIAAEAARPMAQLPPVPALPAGEWRTKDVPPVPRETNRPSDVLVTKGMLTNGNLSNVTWGPVRNLPGAIDRATGKRVIKYSFQEPRLYPLSDYSRAIAPMSPERREAARAALAEIEKVANIKFEEITDPREISQAHFIFAEAEMRSASTNGYSTHSEPRFIVMRNDTKPEAMKPGQPVFGTMTHEILHALGLSHPGAGGRADIAGGDNPGYSRSGTIMSYNLTGPTIAGLGPYDIAVLQDERMYGPNRDAPTDKTFTLAELTTTSTVYSQGTAKLDFRDTAFTGKVKVDLSSNLLYPISGTVRGPKGEQPFDPRIAIGTNYEILVDDNTRIAMDITGRKDANIRGGRSDDVLTATGGNNTLTGGRGRDTFVLTTASGLNNAITDFNPAEDTLMLRSGASRVVLEATGRGGPSGTDNGTLVKMYKDGADAVSVMFLKDVAPETARANMVVMADSNTPAPRIEMPRAAPAPSNPTPPPLPVPVPAPPSSPARTNEEYARLIEETLGIGKAFGSPPDIVTLPDRGGAPRAYIRYRMGGAAGIDTVTNLGKAIDDALDRGKPRTGLDRTSLKYSIGDAGGETFLIPIDELKKNESPAFWEGMGKAKDELTAAVKAASEEAKRKTRARGAPAAPRPAPGSPGPSPAVAPPPRPVATPAPTPPAPTPPASPPGFAATMAGALDTIGTGTAAGAAIGGIGALILSFFMKGKDGEGPGFFKSLFMIIAGAALGGLAGGLIKKDGPLFSPRGPEPGGPLPDGSQPVSRPFGMAAAPRSGETIELDFEAAKNALRSASISVAADARIRPRLLLKAGEVTDTSASFVGMYSVDGRDLIRFDAPVEVPVTNGKVDYTMVSALSAMRMIEGQRIAPFVKLGNLSDLTTKYGSDPLNAQQQNMLRRELMLSAVAKSGKVTPEMGERIVREAVRRDGTLNKEFLTANAGALGIDQRRAFVISPDGDNINIAAGTLSADERRMQIDQALVIDVKKVSGPLRDGRLDGIISRIGDAGKSGFDLSMIAALGSTASGGITYRKPAEALSVSVISDTTRAPRKGTLELGTVNMMEFNANMRRITAGSSTEVTTPAAPLFPGVPATSTRGK